MKSISTQYVARALVYLGLKTQVVTARRIIHAHESVFPRNEQAVFPKGDAAVFPKGRNAVHPQN